MSTRSTAPHTAPGQPVIGGVGLPDGYGYQWRLPAGVTIVKLSANRAYGTAQDMSTNRDGECLEYLGAIAKSIS